MSERDEIIRTATAATLRQVAGWVSDDSLRDSIYDAAELVERSGPEDWDCCPVCEEVECDDGCPLEPIRLDYERNHTPAVTEEER